MAVLLVLVVLAAFAVDDGLDDDDGADTPSPAPASPPAQANQRAPPFRPLAIPAGALARSSLRPCSPDRHPPTATDPTIDQPPPAAANDMSARTRNDTSACTVREATYVLDRGHGHLQRPPLWGLRVQDGQHPRHPQGEGRRQDMTILAVARCYGLSWPGIGSWVWSWPRGATWPATAGAVRRGAAGRREVHAQALRAVLHHLPTPATSWTGSTS
jgi:hypothetical protein